MYQEKIPRKMLHILIYILIITHVAFTKLEVPKDPQPYSELTKYLKAAKVTFRRIHPTISIIRAYDGCTRDLGDYFLKTHRLTPLYVENNGSRHRQQHLVKSLSVVAFLETFKDFRSTLEDSYKIRFFHSYSNIHFVICEPVPHYNWILNATADIWYFRYLNFVIVFNFNNRLEVIGFNPFNNTILNFTKNFANRNIFSSKLNDIYGFELKVYVIPDIRNPFERGRFRGQDGVILTKFVESLNASIKYLIPYNAEEGASVKIATQEIQARRADFFFITRVLGKETEEQRYAYPHEKDDVVVMVRRAEPVPQYLKILRTFTYKVWVTIVIFLLMESMISFTVQRLLGDKSSFLQTFLHVYVMLLNISYPALFRKVYPVKVLLVFWSYFALILYAAFSSSFISTLIVPKYYDELNTISDIRKAGFEICLSQNHSNMLPPEDRKQFNTSLPKPTIYNLMWKGDTSCAYALPRSYMLALIKDHEKYGRNMYHMALEHIIPSLGSYVFPAKSPYVMECEKVVASDKEFGFMSQRRARANKQNRKDTMKAANTVLTLNHLQAGFYVLLLGYGIGGFMFVLERISYRYYWKFLKEKDRVWVIHKRGLTK